MRLTSEGAERGGVAHGGNVRRLAQDDLIVRALQVREALGAGDLAVLEAQAGEPVAAHRGVGAAGGRDQGEAADGKPGGREEAWRSS